jgi:DNA repair protein RadC
MSKLHNLASENTGVYQVINPNVTSDDVIKMARSILESRMKRGCEITDSTVVKDYLMMKYAQRDVEVFGLIFLDSKHRVLSRVEVSKGTIAAAAVYPREVVKAAIKAKAKFAILHHNHPSGVVEPSMADQRVTERLKKALGHIDVTILDHIIAGKEGTCSFAERALL